MQDLYPPSALALHTDWSLISFLFLYLVFSHRGFLPSCFPLDSVETKFSFRGLYTYVPAFLFFLICNMPDDGSLPSLHELEVRPF